jgi:hypothetical protein
MDRLIFSPLKGNIMRKIFNSLGIPLPRFAKGPTKKDYPHEAAAHERNAASAAERRQWNREVFARNRRSSPVR